MIPYFTSFLFLVLQGSINAQFVSDLYYNTDIGITYQSSFFSKSSSAPTISCGGEYAVMGPSTGYLANTYTLPMSHSSLTIFFTMIVIGDWGVNDYININAAGISYKFAGSITQNTANPSCTGMTSKFGIAETLIQISHSANFITLNFSSNFATGRAYAMRDLVINMIPSIPSRQCFMIEASLTSTSSNLCPCQTAHYFYSCNPCNANHLSCNSFGAMRCVKGYFQTTSFACSACSAGCMVCNTISSNCLACYPGYYLQSNKICNTTCYLLTRSNMVGGTDCYSPCSSSQVFLNSQCFSSCPLGFSNVSLNNAWACRQTCDYSLYYYQGSCYTSCVSPLYPKVDNATLLNICFLVTCPMHTALLPDGTCTPTLSCPAGMVLNTTNPNLAVCVGICSVFYYYQNGTCIPICQAPFFPYTDPDTHILYCVLCNGTDGYAPDKTCLGLCSVDTVNATINGIIYCQGPCPLGEYSFNNTCLPSCSFPYHEWIDPTNHIPKCVICENDNNYTLPDYSCSSSCPIGLNSTVKDGLLYCLGTCQNLNQYLRANNTCSDDCLPPYNPFRDSVTKELICKLCDGTDGSLPNMICTSVCPSNTVNMTIEGEIFCRPLCPAGQYLYKNGSCLPNCLDPYFWDWDADMFNVLCMLCNGTDGLQPNNLCISTCPNNTRNQTINYETYCLPLCDPGYYIYKNGSCGYGCLSPYTSFWDGDMFNQYCYICNGSFAMLPNTSCTASCPNSTRLILDYQEFKCEPLCPAGQYLFNNMTCSYTCVFPYKSYDDAYGFVQICSICNGSQAILPNYTCVDICPLNYANHTTWNETFCSCELPNSLYKDGTCSPNCLSYFTPKFSSDNLRLNCDLCPLGQIFLPDMTCSSNYSQCMNSFTITSVFGETICNNSCPLLFYHFNGSCMSFCPNNTVQFHNNLTHEFSCFVPISLVSINQLTDTTFSVKFNTSLHFKALTQPIMSILFIGSTVAPEYTVTQTTDDEWSIVFSNIDSSQAQQLQISFSESIVYQSNGIALLFLQNMTIPVRKQTQPPIENGVPEAALDTLKTFSASSMATAASSAIVASSALGFKVQISMVQYLMALLFLNVDYPANLQQFLQIFKVARMQFIPNPFKPVTDSFENDELVTPEKFMTNQFSSFLLDNVGNLLLISCIFLFIHLIGVLLIIGYPNKKTNMIVHKVLALAGIPGLLSFLIGFSVIINISCTLQIRYPDSNPLLIFSTICSYLVITLQIYFLKRLFSIKKEISLNPLKKTQILKSYENLLKGQKPDKGGVPHPFLAIVIIRDFIQFSLLVLLYDFPIIQIVSQLVATLSLFTFIVIKRPYLSKIQNFMDASREFFLVLIFIVVIFIYADDQNQSVKGLNIIIFCCFVVVTQFLGGIILLMIDLRSAIKRKKGMKIVEKKRVSLNPIGTNSRRIFRIVRLGGKMKEALETLRIEKYD